MSATVVNSRPQRRCSSVVEQRFRNAKPCGTLPQSAGNHKSDSTGSKAKVARSAAGTKRPPRAAWALRQTLERGGLSPRRVRYYLRRIDALAKRQDDAGVRSNALKVVALEAAQEIARSMYAVVSL